MQPLHPVLFVSHGAPDLLLDPGATGQRWSELGAALPRPSAILAVSAHWESAVPTVSRATAPQTIHDFGGFPRALYSLRYDAPGAPTLADRVAGLLGAAGIPVSVDPTRGLDHGAWAPLRLLYPAADIPVTQLAIQPQAGPRWHLRLGEALQPLREEGVLILASGAVTHNFAWLTVGATQPYPAAAAFADWLADRLAAPGSENLIDYRRTAPQGAAAHPTEEHLLPLFVARGAGGPGAPQRFAPGFIDGGLAMDAYLWPGGMAVSRPAGGI
ncbi:class III extradiol ring-cleavage dioxygenase [uncultured Thiodictyon sp.]|uniref:DODA-type extradiol aromatic ring-opening family dioxygenase n=1 Tax=uncultured Thiodictyon sp. TaxID=1846217 RepID=UPI0025EF2910|nr:class III extradiol ring-cleavage dioxygenase [uncultured Thiodictyon sp.]